MNKSFFNKAILLVIIGLLSLATQAQVDAVFVDEQGVMRWQSSNEEANFYGVNYTLPFAHGFRAAQYLNIDLKESIDKDVYHMARLGFNAYRVHIWDVEISDAEGNLLENEHLDLLDYLLAQLQKRGIYIVLTAQTNFGNGYPERNINTGAFSYLDDKCKLHANPEIIRAQENYLAQLVQHRNPYTQKSYMNDPYVVGFELNNEPCHAVSTEQTLDYINSMVASVRNAGCEKPLFYNASHNLDYSQAYFDADVQGVSYQWYPAGLVSGRTKKANFLPHVDSYPMPQHSLKGYENKAKLIYEYDPADMLAGYIHPAMVRSFRSAGFQWATQFAYDPLDLAWANTEYQTHYLNLAYTPSKAISLMISAEVMQQVKRGEQFSSYPADTIFGNFQVSYQQDLSLLNEDEKFIYSNSTTAIPIKERQLKQVAGVGSSPLVDYQGSGAYFLDKIANGLWRLELMPDVILTEDPFAKPSLTREVGQIYWTAHPMQIHLKELGEEFVVKGINEGNDFRAVAQSGKLENLLPGVYLLGKKEAVSSQSHVRNLGLTEFVAPPSSLKEGKVYAKHEAQRLAAQGIDLQLSAQVVSLATIDSVLVYPSTVSFWSEANKLYAMTSTDGEHFTTVIPANDLHGKQFDYNLVVFADGKATCFPQEIAGTPLDWDFLHYTYYSTQLFAASNPIVYLDANQHFEQHDDARIWRKDIGEQLRAQAPSDTLILQVLNAPDEDLQLSLITSEGITYSVKLADYEPQPENEFRIPWNDFKQSKTRLLPVAYPVFMNHYFETDKSIPLNRNKIEILELAPSNSPCFDYDQQPRGLEP
ncbi:MAG: hypothetical protein ACK5LR_04280 [Mangrovibacterium sp.]